MKQLRANLKSQSGETIVETILAVVIFVIYMLAITATLNTSLQITKTSTQSATNMQHNIINPAVLSDFNADTDEAITFSSSALTSISATHNVFVYNKSGIMAFTPNEEGET